MGANLELIRATYEGESEDNGRHLKDGKIVRMTQYVDTVLVQRALVP
jgi:hypothetical protein